MSLTPNSLESGSGPHATLEPVAAVEILVDHASVETFVNHGAISSTRYFQPDQQCLSVKSENGDFTNHAMSLHVLKAMWETN